MSLVIRAILVLAIVGTSACSQEVQPFTVVHVERSFDRNSHYPIAVNPDKVGTFSGTAKSGAGYFYDEVLEYRVWLHPERGADPLAGKMDYFAAFAQYEPALKFSQVHKGAEPPLALVRQIESVNEPSPGVFEWDKEERITEWQPQWLIDNHRMPNSIPRFLKEHASAPK